MMFLIAFAFTSSFCHSDDQREEDELLKTCPKNLEYIKRE